MPSDKLKPLWRVAAENALRRARDKKARYQTAEEIWAAACAYFQWVEDNPIVEAKAFHHQGQVTMAQLPRMRAMTKMALCLHIGVTQETWHRWSAADHKFSSVCSDVNQIIVDQKFSGAAADMLNALIISRDLGLKDQHEHSGPDGQPVTIIASDMPAEEAAALYSELIRKSRGGH